jgi:hypothetical protein
VAEEACRLTSEDEHTEVNALVKGTLQEIQDQKLQIFLADIGRHLNEFNVDVEKGFSTADRLLPQDRYAEAIKFLEGNKGFTIDAYLAGPTLDS